MRKLNRLAGICLAATTLAVASPGASRAQLPLVLLDMMFKQSNKQALATPGHAEWCANSRPGYRKQWNNWRQPDGNVTYCASPFYTPPWQVPYAKR